MYRCWTSYNHGRFTCCEGLSDPPAGASARPACNSASNSLVNLPARQAEIHGLDPENQAVVFESRNDEHRQWFEDSGRERRPGQSVRSAVAAAPPQAGGEDVWHRWLAGQPDFKEAAAVLAGGSSGQNFGSTRTGADILRSAASALRQSHNTMARWLAMRSLDLYHAWMSQATSGGEGSAMQYEVRNELEELRQMVAISQAPEAADQ